jgi:hypothetical protein
MLDRSRTRSGVYQSWMAYTADRPHWTCACAQTHADAVRRAMVSGDTDHGYTALMDSIQ